MARYRQTVQLRSVTPRQVADAAVEFHETMESLRPQDDGSLRAADGRTGRQLRLLEGEHLRPGAQYGIRADDGPSRLNVLAWDRRGETAVRLGIPEGGTPPEEPGPDVEARLAGAERPRLLRIRGTSESAPGARHGVTGTLRLDLERWWTEAGGPRQAPLIARAEHPMARLEVRAWPRTRPDGDWDVTVQLTVTGRGLLRPLAAVPLQLARGRVERKLAQRLEELARTSWPATVDMLRLPRAELRRRLLDWFCGPAAQES
ncbi:hypothetical protein GCM10009716_15510 [Streptomyces sodiiphilus]|uniref:SRPBCC family protein n=1 Tax=Streptomyces sodiiphilus TaxID=226217 RepID=A0ABN2NZZ9_9ACTN